MSWELRQGDVLERLAELDPESVQTCVTSPPYFGLRDYGHEGQIGLESTLEEYVAKIVEVAGAVHRVLRRDGTFWLNIGDSYASKPRGTDDYSSCRLTNPGTQQKAQRAALRPTDGRHRGHSSGIKHKDLLLIPARVALALQEAGWWVRMDVVWHKPNPTPESVTDRPTRTHEFIFLLTRAERYYYDHEAIREEGTGREPGNLTHKYEDAYNEGDEYLRTKAGLSEIGASEDHNKPSVWRVAKVPFADAHFACFPPKLIVPCILAGSRPGDLVLDPFAGSGTTLMVAERLGRDSIGIELNPEYIALARERINNDAPLLNPMQEVEPTAPEPEGLFSTSGPGWPD